MQTIVNTLDEARLPMATQRSTWDFLQKNNCRQNDYSILTIDLPYLHDYEPDTEIRVGAIIIQTEPNAEDSKTIEVFLERWGCAKRAIVVAIEQSNEKLNWTSSKFEVQNLLATPLQDSRYHCNAINAAYEKIASKLKLQRYTKEQI